MERGRDLGSQEKHLIEVVDGNDMYEIIKPNEVPEGALRLDTVFALADREDEFGNIVLKARLCARDFAKGKQRLGVFAASSSPITSKIIDLKATEEDLLRMTFDVTAAYPQLFEPDVVVVRPPPEWIQMQRERGLDTEVLWRMLRLMPGRRIAGREWVKFMAEVFVDMDFERHLGAPNIFYHRVRNSTLDVHMDDGHVAVPPAHVDSLTTELKARLPLKKINVHYAGDEYSHLQRPRVVHRNGVHISSNQK